MTGMRLSGPEVLEVRDALRAAFRRSRFGELLLRLDISIDDYSAPADDYPSAILNVVIGANSELWWRDLLRAARRVVPADPWLQELGARYGLAPIVIDPACGLGALAGQQLEIKVKAAQATVDIRTWRERLGAIEGRVCRIEYPSGSARGTGFLIGPDRVLTNYHVIEPVVDGGFGLARFVGVRFDYLVDSDGVTVNAGTEYALADQWLVDASKPSAQDRIAEPFEDPKVDELDYAILRLRSRAGDDPVGGPTAESDVPRRGWIDPSVGAYSYAPETALYIVQHPDGKPMQVALDSNGMLGRNDNGTRVRYTTTTEPGSSGSPCFDPNWGLIALHHSGDPRYPALGSGRYNQGIPIAAIQSLLTSRNLAGAFGPDPLC